MRKKRTILRALPSALAAATWTIARALLFQR